MIVKYNDIVTNEPTAVTLGNFDGVHIGHRRLIDRVKQVSEERNLKAVVLTFSPHPRLFFGGGGVGLITTDIEKAHVFSEIKIDYSFFIKFDKELRELTPEQFVDKILVKALNCKYIAVGENNYFGKNKSGNAEILKALCGERNISAEILERVCVNGKPVSSKSIRGYLADGELKNANEMLFEPYFLEGRIIHGRKVGRKLGFPTINIEINPNKMLPKNGVYFSTAEIERKVYKAITNVGIRPTISGTTMTVESFLIDFSGEIYDEYARIRFLKWSRDEKNFESLSKLSEAISDDRKKAEEFFENLTNWY